jgi:hypothetical protein
MATTDGTKYWSVIDGAAVGSGVAVAAGSLTVKDVSADDGLRYVCVKRLGRRSG